MATILGTPEADDILASERNAAAGDEIVGLGGDDTIEADVSNIVVDGGGGSDFLTASANNVTLYGGGGEIDLLQSNSGVDGTTMEGGEGDDELLGFGTNDTASYAGDPALNPADGTGVAVDLFSETVTDGYGGTDFLIGIENVTGSAYHDTLSGNDGRNVLQGGGGNDILAGRAGDDVFQYSFELIQVASERPLSFGEWLGTEHGQDLGNLRQNEFVQNYKGWLDYLAGELRDNFGFDTIPQNAKVSFQQNDADGMPKIEGLSAAQLDQIFGDATAISIKTGKTSQERYYSDIDANSSVWGGGNDFLASNDGFDTILDFSNGANRLQFDITADVNWDEALGDSSLAYLESFFSIDHPVANDTRLSFDMNGDNMADWSVTLANADLTETQVFNVLDISVNGSLIG